MLAPPRLLLLIVDRDEKEAARLADALAEHEVTSIVCADGAEALVLAGSEHPDGVLVSATLPIVDGAVFARALSARTDIPVVVGIGNGDGPAAAQALAAGARACVAHPYRVLELLPILKAIRPDDVPRPPLEAGGLRLDPSSLEVHLRGRAVRLPMRELRLLQLLMTNADRVVTREQIRDTVWGGVPGSNTITVHIQRLRQRLGDDQDDPRLILTIRGVGYRLIPPPRTP